jgi:hypothetical protein
MPMHLHLHLPWARQLMRLFSAGKPLTHSLSPAAHPPLSHSWSTAPTLIMQAACPSRPILLRVSNAQSAGPWPYADVGGSRYFL